VPGPRDPGPRVLGPRVKDPGPRVPGPRVPGPRVPGPRVLGLRVPGPRVPGPRVSGYVERNFRLRFSGFRFFLRKTCFLYFPVFFSLLVFTESEGANVDLVLFVDKDDIADDILISRREFLEAIFLSFLFSYTRYVMYC